MRPRIRRGAVLPLPPYPRLEEVAQQCSGKSGSGAFPPFSGTSVTTSGREPRRSDSDKSTASPRNICRNRRSLAGLLLHSLCARPIRTQRANATRARRASGRRHLHCQDGLSRCATSRKRCCGTACQSCSSCLALVTGWPISSQRPSTWRRGCMAAPCAPSYSM